MSPSAVVIIQILRAVQTFPHDFKELTTVVVSTSTKGGTLSSGAKGGIAGGVVGAFVLVGVIALILILRRKPKDTKDNGNNMAEIYDETQNSDRQYPSKNVGDTSASGNLGEKRIIPEYLGNEN